MLTKTNNTIVVMPDESRLEVAYYCVDSKPNGKNSEKLTQLYIQLHDCICIRKIDKSISSEKENDLETLVHNKVIHERWHLCGN